MNKKVNKIITNVVLFLICLVILFLFFGGSDNNKKEATSKINVSVLEKEDILNQSYKTQLSSKIDDFEKSINNISFVQNLKDDLNNKIISVMSVSSNEAKLELINDFEKTLKKYESYLDKEYTEKSLATINEIKSNINTVSQDLGLNNFNFDNYNNIHNQNINNMPNGNYYSNNNNNNYNPNYNPNDQYNQYNNGNNPNPDMDKNIGEKIYDNIKNMYEETLPIVDIKKSYLLDLKPGESIKVRDKDTLEVVVLKSIKQEDVPTIQNAAKEEKPNSQDIIIPAGAFVSANLISGLIAPSALEGINNPVPALFKIYGNAIIPNEKYIDLDGCFILAESKANLSSETVSFRLKTLTCSNSNNEIIERNVDGYITGENGMEGMVGRVVSKQGALLARAFLGEFASGISDSFENSANISTITGGGIINQVNPNKALQASLAKGIGNSFNTLGNFYKSMAKEMVPVIEINAGRKVNIIFTKSIKIGETNNPYNNNFLNNNKDLENIEAGNENIYYDDKNNQKNSNSSTGFLELNTKDIKNFINSNNPLTY